MMKTKDSKANAQLACGGGAGEACLGESKKSGKRKKAFRSHRPDYEQWVSDMIESARQCRMERSLTCIPLRGDDICRACYEAACVGEHESEA